MLALSAGILCPQAVHSQKRSRWRSARISPYSCCRRMGFLFLSEHKGQRIERIVPRVGGLASMFIVPGGGAMADNGRSGVQVAEDGSVEPGFVGVCSLAHLCFVEVPLIHANNSARMPLVWLMACPVMARSNRTEIELL
jgi:hypothetical protein